MLNSEIIEHLNPALLTPHPDNSMLHGEGQITQLVASFEQFGFNGVIVIDENNTVLAGHGRRLAALRMGMPAVPCLRKTTLTDAQKRAYIIADNKIGRNSEWDEDKLAQQIEDLANIGIDLDALGISDAALETIVAPADHTASSLRAIEEQASAAPASDAAFDKEMADKSTAGLLPIVPIYAEHHEAFIIVCDNAIDEAWLRNKLGLEKPQQSYKDVKIQRANVITVAQLRERLQ